MDTNLREIIAQIDAYSAEKTLPTAKTTALFHSLLSDAVAKATSAEADGTFFVKTGDIPAMWLRDATFQVLPYIKLMKAVPELKNILIGVLRRELRYVQHDPYANAFNQTASGAHWSDDDSDIPVSDLVWERKFEIDSLCAPLFLALKLYKNTDNHDFLDDEFWQTLSVTMTVLETEQHHDQSSYYFKRVDCPANDTLTNDGKGTPVGYTGMVWDGFRPSDNACEYGYHVPSNMFLVAVLSQITPLIPTEFSALKVRVQKLVKAIKQGITHYAMVTLPTGQVGYAYEVDGLGHQKLMDDANVPSLLALPFIGYTSIDDSIYQNTREFILSKQNPYYYEGKILAGIGSNHTPEAYVWPISLAMEGLTSTDPAVKVAQLEKIAATDNETDQCHESVSVDDVSQYTRDWFSWANMTYCELALDVLGV
ncbi:glycoside hydrolase family 125 protein [Lactiplantibacillus sp. WILCCON 0030]|uniref:Glycoside hydrolase family 125 protein n=1 Tax=Lactiplantibacillus brownii TaxID=3069269 RepID=A0ABU1ACL4_9LACO|nr:glycoside hydrolase family 125 protein [Lactiplantibacillus brownii]MDQ7938665.1 glycoside hydrolase family 125 protein [Lactiplantibacillus brownii]